MNLIGKLQRVNPLPPGTYWIDIIGPAHEQLFAGWLFDNQTNVKALATEHIHQQCDVTGFDCWPSRDWVKFQVNSPVSWDAVSLGFPNIVSPGEVINNSSDTASLPDPSDECDIVCQSQKVAIAAAVVAASALAIAFAIKVA